MIIKKNSDNWRYLLLNVENQFQLSALILAVAINSLNVISRLTNISWCDVSLFIVTLRQVVAELAVSGRGMRKKLVWVLCNRCQDKKASVLAQMSIKLHISKGGV